MSAFFIGLRVNARRENFVSDISATPSAPPLWIRKTSLQAIPTLGVIRRYSPEVKTMPGIVIVSNVPAPYRVPVYERLARMPGIDLHVVFCALREPNRLWDLPPLDFPHTFLKERFVTVNGRYIHVNTDAIKTLRRLDREIVITDGFNPTHLLAYAYATWKRKLHIAMTDGTDVSERDLSRVHKAVRRMVYARSQAFISASFGGRRLYESYGIRREQCFFSCLCIDNKVYAKESDRPKEFDFIFSGRIEPVKNPGFALQVAAETAQRLGRKTRLLFIGNGSLESELHREAAALSHLVEARFYGHAMQAQLPALYASARVLLFPTTWDPWGVVANEACAAGLPVMTTQEAGVAGELVVDGVNGFVCQPDVKKWGERAAMLLSDDDMWKTFSEHSMAIVEDYSIDKAAMGIVQACRFALSNRTEGMQKRAMGRL
jgi:glycosyltransferase involved in cell wall biosynthesis